MRCTACEAIEVGQGIWCHSCNRAESERMLHLATRWVNVAHRLLFPDSSPTKTLEPPTFAAPLAPASDKVPKYGTLEEFYKRVEEVTDDSR